MTGFHFFFIFSFLPKYFSCSILLCQFSSYFRLYFSLQQREPQPFPCRFTNLHNIHSIQTEQEFHEGTFTTVWCRPKKYWLQIFLLAPLKHSFFAICVYFFCCRYGKCPSFDLFTRIYTARKYLPIPSRLSYYFYFFISSSSSKVILPERKEFCGDAIKTVKLGVCFKNSAIKLFLQKFDYHSVCSDMMSLF